MTHSFEVPLQDNVYLILTHRDAVGYGKKPHGVFAYARFVGNCSRGYNNDGIKNRPGDHIL